MEATLPLPWKTGQKVAFRFFFLLFGLFILFENNGVFPFSDILLYYPIEFLHGIIPLIGKHILHLPYDITTFTNGSGDTTYDYVLVLCIGVISMLGSVVWTLVDRKPRNYDVLYYWLTVAVRYYIALMLINYGLSKVFKLQFPGVGPYRLSTTFSDCSPMGLAWTYLGHSYGYNVFMGVAELAAGLLLFRRTMTVGAIITLMTTANVMAVNYFYDVPVKILSTALVFMTCFLLFHDHKRLWRFFFSGQPVALPKIQAPVYENPQIKKGLMLLKILVIVVPVIIGLIQAYQGMQQYGPFAQKPPLYGLYTANQFVMNQDTLPPLTTDDKRWKQLIVEWPQTAMVKFMNDSVSYYQMTIDTTASSLELKRYKPPHPTYTFTYEQPTKENLILKGRIGEDTLNIELANKLANTEKIHLLGRGFRWINEYPFNR